MHWRCYSWCIRYVFMMYSSCIRSKLTVIIFVCVCVCWVWRGGRRPSAYACVCLCVWCARAGVDAAVDAQSAYVGVCAGWGWRGGRRPSSSVCVCVCMCVGPDAAVDARQLMRVCVLPSKEKSLVAQKTMVAVSAKYLKLTSTELDSWLIGRLNTTIIWC